MNRSTEPEPPPMRDWPRSRLLNVWVDDLTMRQLMERLDSGIVFTLNPDHCYHLQRNAEFHAAYRKADFITSDSKYVYWALGWLGRRIQEKVSGSDIVPAFCRHHASNPSVKIFLLGAGPGIAQRARERINARTGREIVVGAHGPSMQFVSDPKEIGEVVQMINASGANVLIVGLGAPKQEIWIERHRGAMPGVKIFMGVGATIDYEADAVVRAPRWMTRNGLEWVYRITTEPRRYWRRYLRDTEFFWLVLLDRLGRYRAPSWRSAPPVRGEATR
ncbi:MAG: WecB/TagA/CpsF family glycosyltransferase [Rhizobacter sp.]|nr:WecB/TagA/CpsF family glycosyltransferase [Rhizobacter sp.]